MAREEALTAQPGGNRLTDNLGQGLENARAVIAALEIRHPALVRYLVQVYEVLWAQATPYRRQLPTTAPRIPYASPDRPGPRLPRDRRTTKPA